VREATDLVARYGGEEFGVILAGADPENAAAWAERLRAEVEVVRPPGGPPPITISIGGASLGPLEHLSEPDLIERADRALYAAKGGGRNRVAWSSPS
jgi:diguanylate cyclase (GGDEF)-like protein